MAIVETLELRLEAKLGDFAAQLSAAADHLNNIGSAFAMGRENLSREGAALVQSTGDAILSAANMSPAPAAAGSELVNKLAQAILAGGASAENAARSTANAASFASPAALSAAHSAGANLSQGFANGILSRMSAVLAAANRVANAAAARIQSALKIHSPSKVTRELGIFFGEGFAGGILDSVKLAELGAEALRAGAVNALSVRTENPAGFAEEGGLSAMVRSAVNEALGGTNFVLPLHVDGVKLGEASIRGINRVTRSAGRLMLEI